MTVDESQRRELYASLETAIGTRPAATLMAHLPPVGWADVATKHDLQELERRLDLRFDAVELRFAAVDTRFEAVERRFESIDTRFESVDKRLEGVDRRLESLGTRLEGVDLRLSVLAVELRKEMSRQTLALLFGLGSLIVSTGGVIVAALVTRGGG